MARGNQNEEYSATKAEQQNERTKEQYLGIARQISQLVRYIKSDAGNSMLESLHDDGVRHAQESRHLSTNGPPTRRIFSYISCIGRWLYHKVSRF